MNFAKNLRKYRKQKGLKAIEFAQMLNLKYPTYLSYENYNKEPKFEVLVEMADLLNVSLDELLGRNCIKTEIYKELLTAKEKECKELDEIVNKLINEIRILLKQKQIVKENKKWV